MQEMQEMLFWPLSWEDPLEEAMATHYGNPVFLTEESHGQRGLAGYSPWGHSELDMTETYDWVGLNNNNETGIRRN